MTGSSLPGWMKGRSLSLIKMVETLEHATRSIPQGWALERARAGGVVRRVKSRVVESEWMDLADLIGDDLPKVVGLPWLAHLREWVALADEAEPGSKTDRIVQAQIEWLYPRPVSMTYEQMLAIRWESLPEYIKERKERPEMSRLRSPEVPS